MTDQITIKPLQRYSFQTATYFKDKTNPIVSKKSPYVYGFLLAFNGFALAGFSSLSTNSYAALSSWQDTMPSALAPVNGNVSQLAQLVDNDIMVYSHVAQSVDIPSSKGTLRYNNVRFSTGAVVLAAKPEQIKQVLSQYSGYNGLFPTLTRATPIDQSGNITRMKYHIHVPVPIPILSFNEDVVMQHQLNANSIQTFIVDSPIQYGMGKFEWFPIDANHTLLTLTQWGDLDKPKGFLVSTILKAIPEAKQGIPASVNTFLLETLKRKYASNEKTLTLQPRQVPEKTLNGSELQLIQQMTTRSATPVMFIHRPVNVPYSNGNSNRPESMQFVTTYANLKAPVARSYQVLSTPSSFKNIFSQVSKVETKTLPNEQGAEAAITVKVGLGVIAIPFKLNLRYFNDANNRIYYQANGGDIEFMQGQMQLNSLNAQQSFIKMTVASKVGVNAPFLLRLGKSLPYSDLLPNVGGNAVFLYKANNYLAKTAS